MSAAKIAGPSELPQQKPAAENALMKGFDSSIRLSTSEPELIDEHVLDLPEHLLDLLPVGVCVCDRTGRILRYNRGAAELWGRAPVRGGASERFCGAHRLYEIDGSSLDHAQSPMAQVLADGAPVRNCEIVIERPDGSRVIALLNIDALQDKYGAIVGAINCFNLVSCCEQASSPAPLPDQTMEQKAAQRLAAIFKSSDDAIVAQDLNGIITSWNKGAERIFGYTEAETIGKPITIIIPLDRLDEEPAILERIRSGERMDHYETVRQRKDGSLIDISLTVSPIKNAKGKIIGASKVARDISERKAAEIAAQRLAAIVESSDDAIVAKDLNGIITSWNKGAERIFGYKEAETIGKPITIIIPPDRQDEEPEILSRIRKGERVDHFETVRQRKDGTLIDISLTVSPIKDAKGNIVGASKIARDITEHRRAQEQQYLLLREMNHRVKNLFTVASSLVALSARGASDAEELARSVQDRLAALARAHELTLARPSPDAPLRAQPATLHALIRNIILPFEHRNTETGGRLRVSGPDIPVGAASVTAFALLVHEFATNAAKYGALSVPSGHIDIHCTDAGGHFTMNWKEEGGPPVTEPAEAEGFGGLLVRLTAKQQLRGEVERQWKPDGLEIRLTFDKARLAA